ncbi:hypothetical protein [Paraburkholderia caledonica]|uniref:hypothetical protein n=1 Tax=Paraburkholderia caledonica TaxID=134536 RepID=UPI0003626950|nr:hypothetical protein [Paraburkholderia caledonica]
MRALVVGAGAIIALSLNGALILLLPAAVVTTAVYVNLVMLGLSVFSLFVAPGSARATASNASTIASLGPQYFVSGLLIACAVTALWAATYDLPSVAYALDVLACGGFVSAQILIRVSQKRIDAVTCNDHDRGHNRILFNRLVDLRDSLSDESLREAVDKVANKVRYGPSPAREVSHGVDAELNALIAAFADANDVSVTRASVRQLDELVGRRSRILQDFRSQS